MWKLMVFAITAGTTLTSGRPSRPVTRRWTQLWLNCPGWAQPHVRASQCGQIQTQTPTNLFVFQNYSGELNYLVALHELYKYINKYYDQVCLHYIMAEYKDKMHHNINVCLLRVFVFTLISVKYQRSELLSEYLRGSVCPKRKSWFLLHSWCFFLLGLAPLVVVCQTVTLWQTFKLLVTFCNE